MAIRRPFVNSTCATSSGLSHAQSRICSLVGANWVRFRSGRLVNGQRQSAGGFNFAHTSRHKRGTTHCVPTRKHQLVAFVVADDLRIERVVGGTRRLRAPVPCRTAPRADPDNDTLIYPLAARFAHLLRRMGIDQRPY